MTLPKNFVWTIEFSPEAHKQFKVLDRATQKRMHKFLVERVCTRAHPEELAEPLKGVYARLFRFRVGDYRIITHIEHQKLRIAVIKIGHRREIYK